MLVDMNLSLVAWLSPRLDCFRLPIMRWCGQSCNILVESKSYFCHSIQSLGSKKGAFLDFTFSSCFIRGCG